MQKNAKKCKKCKKWLKVKSAKKCKKVHLHFPPSLLGGCPQRLSLTKKIGVLEDSPVWKPFESTILYAPTYLLPMEWHVMRSTAGLH